MRLFPLSDVDEDCLVPVRGSAFWEWQGEAVCVGVVDGGRTVPHPGGLHSGWITEYIEGLRASTG